MLYPDAFSKRCSHSYPLFFFKSISHPSLHHIGSHYVSAFFLFDSKPCPKPDSSPELQKKSLPNRRCALFVYYFHCNSETAALHQKEKLSSENKTMRPFFSKKWFLKCLSYHSKGPRTSPVILIVGENAETWIGGGICLHTALDFYGSSPVTRREKASGQIQ